MRIFTEGEGSFINKVNFVDELNTSIGYDLAQDCCEDAEWFILDHELTTIDYNSLADHRDKKELTHDKDYTIDTEYRKVILNVLDDGGMAIFKFIALKSPAKYLHLVNSHNGYYAHSVTSTFFNAIDI